MNVVALKRKMLPSEDKSVFKCVSVVLETIYGLLNDIKGFYVSAEYARAVLHLASPNIPWEDWLEENAAWFVMNSRGHRNCINGLLIRG